MPSVYSIQKEAQDLERKFDEDMKELLLVAQKKVRAACHEMQQKLQTSPEAALVRLLRSMLDKATSKLIGKAMDTRSQAASRALDEKAGLRENGRKEHRSVLQQSPVESETMEACVCEAPRCHKIYTNVPLRKRCSVDDCDFALKNCGCGVTLCNMCHENFCPVHASTHKEICPARSGVWGPAYLWVQQNT